MTPSDRPTFSERAYSALLRLYPRDFRETFGPDMCDMFRDQLNAARERSGLRGVAARWFRVTPDLLATALRERIASRRAVRIGATTPRPDTDMLTAAMQDARYSARILRKNPVFTLVAIAVVALGTGAVSTIYSVANAVVLRPIPGVANAADVVTIERTQATGGGSLSASYPYYENIAKNTRSLSGVAAWEMIGLTVSTGGEGVVAHANLVSGNYFDLLGVRPSLGRFFLPDEDRVPDERPVVVISHDFWQRRFAGDSAVVGRGVLVNGRQFTIIGIAPPRFSGLFPVLRTDAWVPLMMQRAVRRGGDLLHSPGSAWLELVGRVAPGASREAARVELAGLAKQYSAANETGKLNRLGQFTGVRLTRASGLPGDATSAVIAFFVVLLAVSALVLLIASVNVASMLLARAVSRRREIAVRIALGASRGRLVRQLLTESIILFALGGAGGTLLALYGTRLLARIELPVDVAISIDLSPDARVLAVTLLVALVTGTLFGLAPALKGSRLDIATSLRGDGGSRRAGSRLRSILVGGQIAASLLLLTTSGLFVRALARGHRADPGFDVTNVATAQMDVGLSGYDTTRGRALYRALRDRMAAQPGVTAVGYARTLPLSMNNMGYDIVVPGYTPPRGRAGDEISVMTDIVDGGYLGATRIPLVSGRTFVDTDDNRAPRVAVVSAAFVEKYWPGENGLGRTFLVDSQTVTIVGVARDAKFRRLDEAPTPFMYLSVNQYWRSDVNLLVRTTGNAAAMAPVIRRELHAIDALLPAPTITTLEQSTAVVLLPQRVAVAVTAALGIAGLILAAIGLYGVVSFSVAQRTREIGVRIALGAARGDVIRMIVGEGMRVVGVGVAIGLILAIAATRALTPFLFGINPLDAMTFVVTTAVLGSTAALASALPARRAAGTDPMEALREN